MSLSAWIMKNGPRIAGGAKEFLGANAGTAAKIAGLGAAGGGAYALAQPAIDDFMTDQALESMGRSAKRSLADTVEFAEGHPYMSAALLGGAGMAGAGMGGDNFSALFDSISPVKIGGAHNAMKRKGRQR